jgi:hypothetical protein
LQEEERKAKNRQLRTIFPQIRRLLNPLNLKTRLRRSTFQRPWIPNKKEKTRNANADIKIVLGLNLIN